jgi:hypothetical protein
VQKVKGDKEVRLCGCQLNYLDAIIIFALAACNDSLALVDLSSNSIGGWDDEPGVAAFTDMLAKVSYLSSSVHFLDVDLSENNIDSECCGDIAEAIASLTIGSSNLISTHGSVLRTLKIVGNPVDDKGREILALQSVCDSTKVRLAL